MPYKERDIEKIYYTIAEVASMVRQNTSALRFWESEFKWLRPKKNKKGNRQYVKKDIAHVMLINWQLKHIGMTVEGVKKAREMCYDKEIVKFVADSQRSYQPPGKKQFAYNFA